MDEPKLQCVFCGGPAKIVGKCHNARVVCSACGMRSNLEDYGEQMEKWLDEVCEWSCKIEERKNRAQHESRKKEEAN